MVPIFQRLVVHKFAPVIAMAVIGVVGTSLMMFSKAAVPGGASESCVRTGAAQPLPLLHAGETGACVSYAQSALNDLKFSDIKNGTVRKSYGVTLSGTYDQPTLNAVIDLQKRLSRLDCRVQIGEAPATAIATDGTIDQATWYFLTTMAALPGYPAGGFTCNAGNPLS